MNRYELTNVPLTRLFDTFFTEFPMRELSKTEALNRKPSPWAQFRVSEHDKGFLVEGELAGVKKEDLKIEVLGDTLKISGSRGSKEEKDNFEYSEFSQSFSLGTAADTDKIEAKFENGYLHLLIPRVEPKARSIELK